MVYVIVAEHDPGEFLKNISLFIDAAGRTNERNTLGPIALFKPPELGRHLMDG